MSRIRRCGVGGLEVIAMQDGATEFGKEIFPDADPDHVDALLRDAGRNAIETSVNAFLVRTGDAIVLVDSGARDIFGSSCGFLPAAMAEAGVDAADVTHLLLTHLHPDHIAGSIDGDGNVLFPRAEVFLTETERGFWTDDGNFSGADQDTAAWQQLAKSVLAAYGDRVTPVADDAEIAGGVSLLSLPGHTPGHVGFRVDSGNESFVSICDTVHAQTLQFADPDICVAFDADSSAAARTRRRLLDMVASDRLPFSGGHVLGANVGMLERSGSGYRLAG